MVGTGAVFQRDRPELAMEPSRPRRGPSARLRRELHCANVLALLVCRARSTAGVRHVSCRFALPARNPERYPDGYLAFSLTRTSKRSAFTGARWLRRTCDSTRNQRNAPGNRILYQTAHREGTWGAYPSLLR